MTETVLLRWASYRSLLIFKCPWRNMSLSRGRQTATMWERHIVTKTPSRTSIGTQKPDVICKSELSLKDYEPVLTVTAFPKALNLKSPRASEKSNPEVFSVSLDRNKAKKWIHLTP